MKTNMEDIDKLIKESLNQEEAKFYDDLSKNRKNYYSHRWEHNIAINYIDCYTYLYLNTQKTRP